MTWDGFKAGLLLVIGALIGLALAQSQLSRLERECVPAADLVEVTP